MKFNPSLAAEELIEALDLRVGLDAQSKSLLARSALFIALRENLPPDFSPADSQGKDLDDEAMLPAPLRNAVRATLNHRAGRTLDEADYRHAFRQHFEYGCHRLN